MVVGAASLEQRADIALDDPCEFGRWSLNWRFIGTSHERALTCTNFDGLFSLLSYIYHLIERPTCRSRDLTQLPESALPRRRRYGGRIRITSAVVLLLPGTAENACEDKRKDHAAQGHRGPRGKIRRITPQSQSMRRRPHVTACQGKASTPLTLQRVIC
jgi:hypothetical protein